MQLKQPSRGLPPAGRRPQENVFRREGEYWTIAYSGVVLRLRDSKGLRYLAHLIAHPGAPISAYDLIQRVDPNGLTLEPASPANGERARLAVTKRIKSIVRKIQEHDASLGYHFRLTVKTGSRCVYLIDPARPVEWTTRGTMPSTNSREVDEPRRKETQR